MAMDPVTVSDLPRGLPEAGIYLFSENGEPLYVGRSDRIRRRLQDHVRADHRKCAFAFLLARQGTGMDALYRQGKGSRVQLMEDPRFRPELDRVIERIRGMEVRYVAEAHPLRQALLEMYAAVSLDTPHNDFGNH